MKLPSGRFVSARTPIYLDSNFTWGEATKNCSRPLQDLYIGGALIRRAIEIEKTIVLTAKRLDEIRESLGNRPIHINSWYRPSGVNLAVGGSKYSRHQYGDAVDVKSNYVSPKAIYIAVEPKHLFGGISCYFNFVHIDWRGEKARW